MKRKPPIAHTLVKSSKSAMMAAIELHNKPNISYRYEIVVLLIINAWELTLKAYIHKYLKNVKLFLSDGTTKPLPECISCVFSNLGKNYLPVRKNIELLYDYRNGITHFYSGYLNPLIFLLVKKNIIFFLEFIKEYFKQDLTKDTNLYLLPIGFKLPYSPIDYFVKHSKDKSCPIPVKAFFERIINITQELMDENIENSVLTDYRIGLINEKRIKNADIIVALSPDSQKGHKNVTFTKEIREEITSENKNIILTRDETKASGTYLHERLSDNLFDEINNVIETNRLLSKSENKFHLGKEVYYRIYCEREHVANEKSVQLLLATTALTKHYAPGLYWFLNLEENISAKLILDFIDTIKSPFINSFLKLILLLGESATNWMYSILNDKWGNVTQPPNYYFTFSDMVKYSKKRERRLLILKMSLNRSLVLPGMENSINVGDLINDFELSEQLLSNICYNIFNGAKDQEPLARILDIITYGNLIEEKAQGIMAFINQEKNTK